MNMIDTLKEKIADVCPMVNSAEDIKEGSNLSVDYGMDSVSLVSLVIDLEESFDIIFEESDFETGELFLFDKLVATVAQKMEQNNG